MNICKKKITPEISQIYQASFQYWAIIDPQGNTIEMVFRRGPIMAPFSGILDPLSHNQIKEKKQQHCNSWTPSDLTFWIHT